MAAVKVTITLPENQVEEIRALVEAGNASNVSQFVQHAVRVALFDAAGWRDMLDQALQQTGGTLTGQERAWADRVLKRESPKRRTGKRRAA